MTCELKHILYIGWVSDLSLREGSKDVSKVIIPADRDDLIELIISGYDFSDDMVLLYFRMSRT